MQAKTLYFSSFLILLLATTLMGCGSPPPNSFITSTTSEIDYISWTNNNGQLSGNLLQVKAASITNGTPTVNNIPITGTINNNHVTINTYSITYLTGDIDNNNRLQVSSADAAGHSVQITWYNISRDDYNTLVTAFNSHIKLSKLIQAVNNDIGTDAPQDSSYSSADYAVQQDQLIISNNNGLIQNLQQPYGCLSTFGLSQSPDNFQLSNDEKNPTFATLDSDFKNVQQQWNSTKNAMIPQVSVPMPWRITQKQIDDLSQTVNTSRQHITAQIVADQKTLDQLKSQYANQVNQYNQVYQQKCQSS
jgi:hypothetical protein